MKFDAWLDDTGSELGIRFQDDSHRGLQWDSPDDIWVPLEDLPDLIELLKKFVGGD